MVKLFITLFLMVLASFFLFLGTGVILDAVSDKLIATSNIEKDLTKGTFYLLDESMTDLDESKVKKLLKVYKSEFGSEFELVDISQITLDKKQFNKLSKGEIVIQNDSTHTDKPTELEDNNDEDNTNIIYRKFANSNQAWKLNMDLDTEVSFNEKGFITVVKGEQFTQGMFYLIQQELAKYSFTEWPGVIKEINKYFGFPLSLSSVNEIKMQMFDSNAELENLHFGKVINSTQRSNYATFVQKIENQNSTHDLAIQVGPIKIPWFIRHILTLVLISFLLSISIALFLWLWPLWSNLQKIKKAANEFGEGNYNARIPYRKRSAIAPIAKAFNAMAERTQRSITTQKELTTAVSHELRTPVARMRFALDMLEESDKQDDKSRYLGSINEDINDLDLLLEELLSYARFDQENTKLDFRLEKLMPWLSNSMDKLMPLANKKLLNYQIEGIGINESAYFEPRLMSRVLDNLVQNALRYADNTVEVTLNKDAQHYVLVVEDDGNGISKADQIHIFDAFSRIDSSRDRSTGGFGLGLAIANRIIKAHRGSITIEDSKLGGAKFEVRWFINSKDE